MVIIVDCRRCPRVMLFKRQYTWNTVVAWHPRISAVTPQFVHLLVQYFAKYTLRRDHLNPGSKIHDAALWGFYNKPIIVIIQQYQLLSWPVFRNRFRHSDVAFNSQSTLIVFFRSCFFSSVTTVFTYSTLNEDISGQQAWRLFDNTWSSDHSAWPVHEILHGWIGGFF